LLGSGELPKALALDYASAELGVSDRAMLDYAVKLTRTPRDIDGADIERLREAGFDDTAVLDICQVTSYYNYVNRMADGLGVELEDVWTEEEVILTRAEFEARPNRR
jgi:uncharacterized peroxidase-related enzyme